MSKRALSPVVATVLLLAVTLVVAGTFGAIAVHSVSLREPKRAVIGVSATATTDRITFTHRAGDSLDVEALDIEIRVNGEPLAYQPPVPFFSADGFHAGPTGPFNSASDPRVGCRGNGECRTRRNQRATARIGRRRRRSNRRKWNTRHRSRNDRSVSIEQRISVLWDDERRFISSSGTRATVVMAISGS